LVYNNNKVGTNYIKNKKLKQFKQLTNKLNNAAGKGTPCEICTNNTQFTWPGNRRL